MNWRAKVLMTGLLDRQEDILRSDLTVNDLSVLVGMAARHRVNTHAWTRPTRTPSGAPRCSWRSACSCAPQPGPCVRVRMAAALTRIGPCRPNPATGQTYIRALATPEQVIELFDWGPGADSQLAAVHEARARLGLPRSPRRPISELPQDGVVL